MQLREQVDALIGGETPPYVTVDRWYLFNLIRVPDGGWAWPKGGRSGSGGYSG